MCIHNSGFLKAGQWSLGRVLAYASLGLPAARFASVHGALPQLTEFVRAHSHLGQDFVKYRRANFTAAVGRNRDCTAIRMDPAVAKELYAQLGRILHSTGWLPPQEA